MLRRAISRSGNILPVVRWVDMATGGQIDSALSGYVRLPRVLVYPGVGTNKVSRHYFCRSGHRRPMERPRDVALRDENSILGGRQGDLLLSSGP